jgi:folate-binding protein YgfZ
MASAALSDRGVVRITGEDARSFLDGLVTSDMDKVAVDKPRYTALLSPQGKILFDFIVVKTGDGFLLDTAREKAAELAKRLTMYKLRAAVEIRDVSDQFQVAAVWGAAPPAARQAEGALVVADPRLADLGFRVLLPSGARIDATASAEDYQAHRIGLGVPEGGKDYVLGDTYPHEALFDQLNGVSFTKGCFVGQEVVSRMQHRATVRKRVVTVAGDGPLVSGPVRVGEMEIGRLGSVSGGRGLALLRLDRVAGAERDGVPVMAGDTALRVVLPAFARFTLEASHDSTA